MIHFYTQNKLDDYSKYILDSLVEKYNTEYTLHEQFYFPPDYDYQENSTHVFCGSHYFQQLRESFVIKEKAVKTVQGFIYPKELDTRFTFFYGLPYLFLHHTALLDLDQIIHVSTLPIDPDLSNCKNVICETKDDLYLLYGLIQSMVTPVALDLETSGLSPKDDRILCIAIGITENESWIIPEQQLNSPITKDILQLPGIDWVGHNSKFDASFIYHHYNFTVEFLNDTMLLHYVLDERQGTHGLKPLSRRLLGLPDYEADIKKYLPNRNSSYSLIPPDILHTYAGYDVCFTLRLLDRLSEFIAKDEMCNELYKVYHFLMQASDMFIDIETTGMYFDRHTAKELEQNYFEKEEDLKSLIQSLTHTGFNPSSVKQVGNLLYDQYALPDPSQELEKKKRCTDKETLSYLAEKNPDNKVIPAIIELRKISKIRSTYISSLIEKVNSDGRLRTQMKLHGTVTGRLSSSSPNFQNFPRAFRNEYARPIRNLITATNKDYILIGADYSQAEIRVAAILSREPFYQQVYSQGLDVHTETAKKLFKLKFIPCEDDDEYAVFSEQRSLAKNLNFGLIYGQGAQAIARLYGMAIEDAQHLFNQFYKTIPNLANWLQETREFAYENGYCMSPFGRKRRFGFCVSPEEQEYIGFGESNQWRIKTMAGNFAIQSLASDVTLQAAIDLHQTLKNSNFKLGKILVLVHDAIYLEVPKKHSQVTQVLLERAMLEAPKKILPTNSQGELFVPFATDIHTNEKWGEL